MDEKAGFIGIPKPKDIPKICSRCHSDVTMMRKYNLKTDQFNLYKTSIHGMRLFEKGDESVATCASCHGNHDIQRPTLEKFTGKSMLDCGGCHYPESPAFKTGADIKAALIEAETLLTAGNKDIALVKENGGNSFAIRHLEDDMDNARTKLLEA